jgi:uncharacterized ion transporter superfamily protein YfcC
MSFGEDDYEMRNRRKSWRTILLPVMGLLLAVCAAGISFALAAPVTDAVRKNISGVPAGDTLQIAIGFGIFIVLMLVFAALYGVFAPKPTKIISEKDLDKEKKLREKEKIAQRKRRRQVNLDMARERRERNE